MNGAALQAVFGAKVQDAGQPLTVTRGPSTTSTVYFLPQPLNANGGVPLQLEAGLNLGEQNAHDFVCAGDSDVLENDRITYNGFKWRVLNANPQMLGGVAVSLHCVAVRESAV